METNMKQRVNMSHDYIRASAVVTCRRLEEIRRSEVRSPSIAREGRRRTTVISLEPRRDENVHKVKIRPPRRKELPSLPKKAANLWSVVRSCIGKDISTVTIPVGFSEPISMLQRLAEEFEYSHLLDSAAKCYDPLEQLGIVAAFVVSGYATSGERLTKPFVPILGETYELDRRDDMGWKLMSEQVLHTPPTSAQFCESPLWSCWKTFSVSTMFRGKYLKVTPEGFSHLVLDTGNLITWNRIESTVHNVLGGKMWLDNVGEINLIDYVQENKCVLKFLPFDSKNTDNQKVVTGVITDYRGETRWILNGKWDSYVEITPVRFNGKEIESIAEPKMIWKVNIVTPDTSVFYNFSLFACQLNEPEDSIPPTDSRMRKDIRLMENGSWEEADALKRKIEQKGHDNEKKPDSLTRSPVWFKSKNHPKTGLFVYVFDESYWRAKAVGDWTRCRNIYE